MATLMRKLLPLAVLLVGVAVAFVLVSTAPKPAKTQQARLPTPVETRTVRFEEREFVIPALGVVAPDRDVMVQPQVGGIVVEMSDSLTAGGRFAAGDLLFRIDPTDYRIAVETRETQLAEAEASLALERGRQEVARREWTLFSDVTELADDPGLALREPQLRVAEAAVAAARAQLEQARVNLQRTTVRAPFDAVVIAESVELGQTLSPQSQAARLVGTARFRVQASVPADRIAYITPDAVRNAPQGPGMSGQPAGAASVARIAYDAGAGTTVREGRVARILGDLDPRGQMARVVIEIDDPLASSPGAQPLLLDSYVQVRIVTNRRSRVFELEREFLRESDTVWLMSEGRLEVRPVSIAWREPSYVLIDDGLADGDRVVVSSIATPVPGMPLRAAETAGLAGGAEQAE